MTDISNLRDTIVPKSDQLNAEQLLGGPLAITVTNVRRGSTEEQPVIIDHDQDPDRPYKPCKTMRKVIIALWGDDGRAWVGRSMVLFNDPEVKFGGVKVGGIRISHMTHIERDTTLQLTATKGKKAAHLVKRLTLAPTGDAVEQARAALKTAADNGMDALKAAWTALPKAVQNAIGADSLTKLKADAVKAAEERRAIDHPEESSAPTLAALNAAAGGAA